MPHDLGSESDVSETIKDQHRELVQTVHNKNKQISDLLRDIEVKYILCLIIECNELYYKICPTDCANLINIEILTFRK